MNSFSSRIDVRVTREPTWDDRFDISIARIENDNGVRAVFLAQPIQFEEKPLDHDVCERQEPALSLRPDVAQKLMDELWQAGLRPSEGSGSAGAMAAVQEHLKDMRKLVFERKPADQSAAAPSGRGEQ